MCSSCNATYYNCSWGHLYVRAFEHLCNTPLTGEFVKTAKKYAIFGYYFMLFEGHTASLKDFSILLEENNGFK